MKRILKESFKHGFFPMNFILTPKSDAKATEIPPT